MGFGHAVYSIRDPRNAVIKEYAKENSKRKRDYRKGLQIKRGNYGQKF